MSRNCHWIRNEPRKRKMANEKKIFDSSSLSVNLVSVWGSLPGGISDSLPRSHNEQVYLYIYNTQWPFFQEKEDEPRGEFFFLLLLHFSRYQKRFSDEKTGLNRPMSSVDPSGQDLFLICLMLLVIFLEVKEIILNCECPKGKEDVISLDCVCTDYRFLIAITGKCLSAAWAGRRVPRVYANILASLAMWRKSWSWKTQQLADPGTGQSFCRLDLPERVWKD